MTTEHEPVTSIIVGTMTLGYRGYGARVHDLPTAQKMLGTTPASGTTSSTPPTGEAGMRQHPVIEAAPAQDTLTADQPAGSDRASDEPVIADDLLVEEVSIDGMCGVY